MTRNVTKLLTEDQEQTLLAVWLAKRGIRFFAIPNGGSRNILEALKLKRTGVKAGVPDICIPIPFRGYHGLYLEIKRQKGSKLSDAQVEWLTFLREKGYYAEIAYGFDQAKEIVNNYFSFPHEAA